VRLEVITAVLMNILVSWHVQSCQLGKSQQCFKGAYYLHLQGQVLTDPQDQDLTFICNISSPVSMT